MTPRQPAAGSGAAPLLALVRDCPTCRAPTAERVVIYRAPGGDALVGCAACRAEVAGRCLRCIAPSLLCY